MRRIFKPALLVFLLIGMLTLNSASAQERSKSGRHSPDTPYSENEENDKSGPVYDRSWFFEVNGGFMGGGDLFSARHTPGDTISWVPESDGDWVSHRIRVGLENSFGMGFQIQRRMGDWYSIRGGATYSQMDMVAEAPIGEIAEVFPYDQADVWLFNAGTEVRLTILTPSYPYMTLDLTFLNFSPHRSDFLSQSNFGGRLGMGYHHQFDSVWAFNAEIGYSRTSLSSIYFSVPSGVEPEEIQYDNENHLSLFEAKFGIRVKI